MNRPDTESSLNHSLHPNSTCAVAPASPKAAGVLLLLAGPLSLGLTTMDPTNPSVFAAVVAILALAAAAHSFRQRRKNAVAYTGLFLLGTGSSALLVLMSGVNQALPASEIVIVALIRGGLGFLLANAALWCLAPVSQVSIDQTGRAIEPSSADTHANAVDLERLRTLAGDQAVCFAHVADEAWICACGQSNLYLPEVDRQECSRCRLDRDFALDNCRRENFLRQNAVIM